MSLDISVRPIEMEIPELRGITAANLRFQARQTSYPDLCRITIIVHVQYKLLSVAKASSTVEPYKQIII